MKDVNCEDCGCAIDDTEAQSCEGCMSLLCDDCLDDHECDGSE